MPSMTKLNFDGAYHSHVENQYKSLKNISVATKTHLLRENDNMEEDEWREKVYKLKELVEEYKQISQNNDPDDQEDSPSEDDY